MKKLLLTLFILLITLTACTTEDDPVVYENEINIFYINDLHGAIERSNDQLGLAYIANFLENQPAETTLFLGGGDLLQGTALSNYFNGYSVVEILNEMNMDAMALGNHEFDWGLDVVTNYFDELEENGEASFPLLSINTFIKGTDDIPPHIDPYTIVERNDKKIGIIGVIGEHLESSIATSKISDYEFRDPLPYVKDAASYLRTEENVDLVLVLSHATGNIINQKLSALTGDEEINAIFNAHSHQLYTNTNFGLPIIQSGSNGEYLGQITFNFNDENQIESFDAKNLSELDSAYFFNPEPNVQAIIEEYLLETDAIFNEEIIVSGEYMSQSELTAWISEVIAKSMNADIAFHNYGGTRTNVDSSEAINLSLLYQIWPFDNVIKTVYLTGSEIQNLIANSSLAYYKTVDDFDPNTEYLVATNDYVFDKEDNPFIYGNNPTNTGLYMRDLAQLELELQAIIYDNFYLNNDILISENDITPSYEEDTVN